MIEVSRAKARKVSYIMVFVRHYRFAGSARSLTVSL